MTFRNSVRMGLVTCVVAATGMALHGCSRTNSTEPWPPITDPLVFADAFGAHVGFQAFGGSKLDALSIDNTTSHSGTSSLKFTVPAPGDPTGGYAGGAFVTNLPRDFTTYNALSFWVKASRAVPLDVAGLGNDNTGKSKYEAKRSVIPMTTSWTQVFVPIPLSAKLTNEKGLFFIAEGPQQGAGLTFWVDDVQFVNSPVITNPRPSLTPKTVTSFVGSAVSLEGTTRTTFAVAGIDQLVQHMAGYFTFATDNSAVTSLGGAIVNVIGTGTADITAKMGALDAAGTIVVNSLALPATAAPTPNVPAADVISMFSNAYANVPVDTWSATWDQADVSDITIAGNATKAYTNLVYSGVEFTTHQIDASAMTHLHLDVWAPSGTTFKVKLVDWGADGVYNGCPNCGDDREFELTFNGASTPAFSTGAWVGLEIPLANFTTLTSRAHLAQLVLSGDTRTVFVDNVYFHK